MDLRLDAEPEWVVPYLIEYVSACLCAATVGVIITLCVIA